MFARSTREAAAVERQDPFQPLSALRSTFSRLPADVLRHKDLPHLFATSDRRALNTLVGFEGADYVVFKGADELKAALEVLETFFREKLPSGRAKRFETTTPAKLKTGFLTWAFELGPDAAQVRALSTLARQIEAEAKVLQRRNPGKKLRMKVARDWVASQNFHTDEDDSVTINIYGRGTLVTDRKYVIWADDETGEAGLNLSAVSYETKPGEIVHIKPLKVHSSPIAAGLIERGVVAMSVAGGLKVY